VRIARIMGLDIRISPWAMVLTALSIYTGHLDKAVIILSSVFFHEAAHLAAARIMGFRIKELELFPLGGVARIEGLFQLSPAREIIISAAGPFLNIFIAVLAYYISMNGIIGQNSADFVIAANVVIALFNLLPVLPMDGGRILRAVLCCRWNMVRATGFVTGLGRVTTAAMLAYAFYNRLDNVFFISMAIASVFLFFAAGNERKMAPSLMIGQAHTKKRDIFNKGMLRSRSLAVACNTNLKNVIENLLPGYYHIVFVIGQDGEVIGRISEDELVRGAMKYGYNALVGRLCRHNG
jgi:stage IV sporulation protein FB